jgi:hypothetical protein
VSYLNASVSDSPARAPELDDALTGAGGWAKVTAASGGLVTVTVDDYDGGFQAFGPVPARDLTGGAGVAVGDRVWLLVDSAGQPGAALKI